MKITVLTQYYKPEMGAPQNRLYEMCDGLHRLGVDVSIITGMPNYPTGKIFDNYKGKFSMKEEVDGMEVKRYWLYASNAKKALPRIFNMLSFSFTSLFSLRYLRKRKNDYLIVESPPLLLGLTGWLLAKFSGAKLVTNISDLWPLSARELGAISGDGFIYKSLEKVEKFLYKKSSFCMGQSQEIVDYIEDHGAKKVYLFRNGVDPDRFKGITRQPKEPNSPFVLTYAGLLGFAQGIAEICKNINFKNLNAEFHIYGAGGEQELIESFIKENPDNGIFYHGKVSREEIPLVLSRSDSTLIPLVKNIYGAVPSKIYESMASGLPIMFSGEGEGRNIVLDNDLGWVSDAKDYKALEANIKIASESPELLEQKRKNCIECAQTKYNRPMQIKALYDFLNSNLDNNEKTI